MEFSNFKYCNKKGTVKTLINVYNYDVNELDVYIRNDYKLIVSDSKKETVIEIPKRIKIEYVMCEFIDDSKFILLVELKLKDLDIEVKWK